MRRIPYIDALRGWAILLVIFDHAAQGSFPIHALFRFSPNDQPDLTLPNWLRAICQSGTQGVVLFFTLSAISLTLSASASGEFLPARYLVRRFLRVAPMYYFGVGFYLILCGWGPRWSAPSGITGADVAENLLFVHGFFIHAINSVVPGGWSIGMEAAFYVVLPWLFAIARVRPKALPWVAALCVALSLSYAALALGLFPRFNLGIAHYPFFEFLPAIAIGSAAALSLTPDRFGRQGASPTSALEQNLHPLALLFLLVVVVPFANVGGFDLALRVILTATLGALLCKTFHESGAKHAFVVNPLLSRIGTVSFSMYILHFALLSPAFNLVASVLTSRGVLFMFSYYVVLTSISFVVSNLTYELIEAPFMRLSLRLTSNAEGQDRGAARLPSTGPALSFHSRRPG